MPLAAAGGPMRRPKQLWLAERQAHIFLRGRLERWRIPPLVLAFVVPIAAVLLFHFVVTPLAVFALLWSEGIALAEIGNSVNELIAQHAMALITANTVGQVVALALPAVLILPLHTRHSFAFIRLNKPDLRSTGLALLGLVSLIPIMISLGNLNQSLPIPEGLRAFEFTQLALLQQALTENLGLMSSLWVLAFAPAVCEEILFRGYVQRQAERSLGIGWGILLTGVMFGAFHLRATQFLPLCAIGIYLAYVTWTTGSLWVAIAVHFANNAVAIALSFGSDGLVSAELAVAERMGLPVHFLLVSLAVLAYVVYLLHQRRPRHAPNPMSDAHESQTK